MPAGSLRLIVVAAVCFGGSASAAVAQPPRHVPQSDPAMHYGTARPASTRAVESPIDTPGQTTVLTRQILDDMKATSVRDALRSTAGVTVGR